MAQTAAAQVTPKTLTVSGGDAAALAAAVQVQVNILVRRYISPMKLGTQSADTPKNVQNNSIALGFVSPVIASNNVTTLYQTITWIEIVDPT